MNDPLNFIISQGDVAALDAISNNNAYSEETRERAREAANMIRSGNKGASVEEGQELGGNSNSLSKQKVLVKTGQPKANSYGIFPANNSGIMDVWFVALVTLVFGGLLFFISYNIFG